MKHYVLYDTTGRIKQTLSVLNASPAPQLNGLTTLEVSAPVDGLLFHVQDGQVVPGGLPDPKALRNALMTAIEALELRQHRPVRELAIAYAAGTEAPAEALALVRDIEAQILTLRAQLLTLT